MSFVPNALHFVIGFTEVPKPAISVWQLLVNFLATYHVLPKIVELSQLAGAADPANWSSELTIKLPVDDVEKVILERQLTAFHCYMGKNSKEIQYFLTDHHSSSLNSIFSCCVAKAAKTPDSWLLLVESIMSRHLSVAAYQFMSLYQFWQRDNNGGSSYERTWGARPSGYRTWIEPTFSVRGQGPDRVFIDISLNPGRTKQLTPTIEFYPTAEMWLGPDFWQYAKCSKEEALAADFWLETQDTMNYTYLKCWPTAFTRPDGEQGRMQQRLWKLFFHEDCEWPPGSGSICDEPVYGPPELLIGALFSYGIEKGDYSLPSAAAAGGGKTREASQGQ
jgi:hypothetical protein